MMMMLMMACSVLLLQKRACLENGVVDDTEYPENLKLDLVFEKDVPYSCVLYNGRVSVVEGI